MDEGRRTQVRKQLFEDYRYQPICVQNVLTYASKMELGTKEKREENLARNVCAGVAEAALRKCFLVPAPTPKKVDNVEQLYYTGLYLFDVTGPGCLTMG